MAKNIITGIDVGSHTIRVVVAEHEKGRMHPRILGVGSADSRGLRHGYIINHKEALLSIRQALKSAEQASGVQIRNAFLSIGGISLESIQSTGTVVISRADNEVTDLDIEKAIAISEEDIVNANKKIIETVPLSYKLDGKDTFGRPEGMKGTKLEVKRLFVTCLEQHLSDLVQTIEDVGVEVEYVIAAPIAASLIALSRKQRTVGCVLVNIGAETVSMVVFEDDMPIFLRVFPIGSTDITNDIALGLQVSLDEAEEIKRTGPNIGGFSRKKLDDIIEARLSDILELIETDLKKLGRNGLLPAGIILTGGGAGVSTIEDLARATLRLPSMTPGGGEKSDPKNIHARQVKDSGWFVAYGLCVYGATQDYTSMRSSSLGQAKSKIKDWFKQLLP